MNKADFAILMVLFAYVLSLASAESGYSAQPAIKGNAELGPLEEGEAAVWYLGHCGYAVKTKNKLLVFDYSKAYGRRGDPTPPIPPQPSLSNGWIDPKEIKDLDVVVFITHSHADHFDEAIRAWEKEIPRIQYVFGWDTGGVRNVHSLPGPRAELSLEGLTIATVNSNDGVPGSAFLIRVDGLTIFFGGDYYGGPAGVADDMRALGAKVGSVNLLFTEAFLTPANDTAIRILKPKVVFPNHRGGHEEEYPAFAASLKKAGLDVPVARPERPGSRFDFRKGRILQGEGNARNSLQTPSPRPIGEKGDGR